MNRTDKILRFIIIAFCLLYLIDFFWQPAYANVLANIFLTLFFILAIPNIPTINRRVCLGFFIPGVMLFLYSGTPLFEMMMAMGRNSGLFSIYTFVPIMTMPFFYTDYQNEIGNIAKRYMTTLLPFLLFILVASYSLSLVMAMGCLLILYDLFGHNAREYKIQLPFRMALLQGYAIAGIWGPSWATPSIITARLNITWLEIVPFGIIFSMLGLLVTGFLLWYTLARHPELYPRLTPDDKIVVSWRKVFTLFTLASILIGLLLFFNYLTGWSMFVIVPLVAFPFAITSALIQNKVPQFKKSLAGFYNERIIRGKPELCLFIVGGFLGTAFEHSQIANIALAMLPQEIFVFPACSSALIMSIIVILAILGMHPVVVGPALAIAITAESIGLTTLTFAMALMSGWVLGVNISPFSSQTMIMTGLEQKTPWEIGPYTNWKFACIMIVVFSMCIGIMHSLGF